MSKLLKYFHHSFRLILLANILIAPFSVLAQSVEVPPQVAIDRPSAQELATLNREFEKFKANASSNAKTILNRYPNLLEVRVQGPNSAIIPSINPQFRTKHLANLEVAKAGNIDMLFMGDSITDFWRNETGNYAGKPVMDRYWGELNIANFGIAGDTTQGVLYRLQNGEGEGFQPKAIMLMIGTNNTRANSAAEISEGVGAIVLALRKHFPEAKILLLGIFPRSTANDPVRQMLNEINNSIATLDDSEHVFYLDIGHVFLDEQGEIPRELMSDLLHPSTPGYELWAEAVAEPLAALLK